MTDTAAENGKTADRRSQADRDGDPLALVKAELAAKDRKIIALEGSLAQRENEIRGLEAALAAVYASTIRRLGAPLRLEHDPEKWKPVFGKDHAPRIS